MNDYMRRRLAIKNGTAAPAGAKSPKPIAAKSEKKKAQEKAEKPKAEELAEWFIQRVAEQTGVCMECNGSTISELYVHQKACVAHVLAKRDTMFPSVATHPENALELCTINGCHDRYDKSWEDASKMNVWPIAVAKFKKILPFIEPSERKNIPDVLWQEVEPG